MLGNEALEEQKEFVPGPIAALHSDLQLKHWYQVDG